MKSFFSPHRLLVALLFVLASCSGPDKKQTAALSDFQTYISGVTTGIIKRSDPVIIKFSHEMIPVDQLGKEAPRSVLSFEPGIDGKARWVATDALEFVPKNLLNWNTKYTATLNLSRLTEVPENLKKLEFCFQTPPKQMRIQLMGLQLSGESEGSYLLKGVVETSDEFEPSELENIFSAFQEKKKRDIAWEHQAKSCLHRFTVSGITRMEKESEVSIRWNGSKIGIKGKEEKQSVPVPSLHDFNVSSARVVNDPDPFVEVVFSDPINPDQDLRGLVVIDQTPVEQFQITENVLKLYPANRLTGMHTLVLNAAIESASGQTMDEKTAYSLNFGGMKPEVRLLGNGVIVPQSTGLFLPFEAVCLQAVDVRIRKIFTNNILSFLQDNDPDQSYRIDRVGRIMHRSRIDLANKGAVDLHSWNAFNLDLSTLIDIEPGAIYHVEIGFRKSYSLFDCNENIDEPDSFVPIDEEDLYPDKEYASVYYQQYYDWELREQPCHQAYYGPDRFAGRNILASNFGMIAKTDPNGKTHAYITNLLSANPEEGVSVEFYDYQNQLLTRATSDKEGMLSVRTERNPFLLVARKGASLAYLKIDNGSLLPTSNFDVSGNKVEKGIKGFLYGERGVWRPGDSVYVSFILDDPQTTLPMEHPLVCEVYNSKGQFVKKMVKSRGTQKMYPFFFKTNTDDPTGNWRIVVKAGGAEFSKTIRIETIKPNRLKVDIHFDDALLSAQRTSTGRLESKWLHGASAGGLKARVDVSFSSYPPVFDRFKEFDFSTPFQTYYGQEIPLFDGTLDENGRSDLIFRFKPNKEVNGFLNANFTTKIFEKGGDFSIHTFSKPFSPYKDYVGLKIDWSYKNWNKLNSDEAHVLSVATVDEQGNPIDVSGVDVKLYELEYRWWYNGDYENLASYAGKTYHKPVFQTRVNTSGGKGSFTLSRNDDRWGRHLLLVTSPNGHVAGQVVYFGWAWGRQQHKGGPQMLALVTEKDACKTGEDITVGFPANKEARALVTFESGSKIIGQQWIENLTDYTQYTFRATPEMAPNVYVHVMLIQPHGQTANDLPIRLYGVVPVRVEDPTTRIKPIIDLPDEIRPLQEFTVRVSEESKKEMEYTLAIVDEGLLDLTHFPTPDPWSAFFAREALGIKTYDFYNYVMGSFGSRLESMFAIGGSDAPIDPSKKKSERFKPVVKVLGPFYLKAHSKASHKITLPQYVGSVRVMLVAAGDGRFGSAEKTVPVREPLMVLATLPRVLSPGETVDLPVTVFAMKEGVEKVRVSIESSDLLKSIGTTDTSIRFNAPGEKDLFFRLRTSDKTGIGRVNVTVSSGSEKSFHEMELDIRPPNLPTIETQFKTLQKNETWKFSLSAFGMEGSNRAQLEISGLPPMNLGSRLPYLIRYPHGCVEQVTSSVFPQLFLSQLLELSSDDRQKTTGNIQVGIEKLQRYQNSDGGFAYWPGQASSNDWGSCYVSHFLLEADREGYLVPGNMKKNCLDYLRKQAADFTATRHDPCAEYTQAYRLFVLAKAGEAQISAMNRLRAEKGLDNQTRWMLAGAYALAGMNEAAYPLIDFRNRKPDPSFASCYGSYLREQSVILQTLTVLNESDQAAKLAREISDELSSAQWYSTQSTAFALVSLSGFARASGAQKTSEYRLKINGKTERMKSNSIIRQIPLAFSKEGMLDVEIENTGEGTLFLNASNEGIKSGIDEGFSENGLQLLVSYFDKQARKMDPNSIAQGEDFIARVTVYNKTASHISDVALNQLFPSGWEIINTRLFGSASGALKNSLFDYQDIRDDRVYSYFSLNGYETKTFSIQLNASYRGEYLLSPVTCGAMYDDSYFAKVPGMKVRVVKN